MEEAGDYVVGDRDRAQRGVHRPALERRAGRRLEQQLQLPVGEFVRLALEEAGAAYVDVARERGPGRGVAAMTKMLTGGDAPPPFAPASTLRASVSSMVVCTSRFSGRAP